MDVLHFHYYDQSLLVSGLTVDHIQEESLEKHLEYNCEFHGDDNYELNDEIRWIPWMEEKTVEKRKMVNEEIQWLFLMESSKAKYKMPPYMAANLRQ